MSGSINVKFHALINVVELLGFTLDRTRGSHHIFIHPNLPEILNLQNINGQAKPYQIKQLVKLIEKHNLQIKDR